MNKMGFLRGFLAILFGIILVPILSLTVMIIADPTGTVINTLITAVTTFDFQTIGVFLYSSVTFDQAAGLSGLSIPLLSAYASPLGSPGLIEAIGAASIGTFLVINLGPMIVWMCVGFFVGAIMSKASKGLLIALGIWIAWFVWNLLFGWLLLPIITGGAMTLAANILPFIISGILPLVILIVSGAIGGAVTKTEVF